MGLCANPYMVKGIPAPCGSCPPCRSSRARVWTHRILLESACHLQNAFVTLTYEDKKLPAEGLLTKKDPQDFIKRLRSRIGSIVKIRYFLVGEYGSEKGRPHYHAVLFGYPPCERGQTEHRVERCCEPCSVLSDTWENGSVDVTELNVKTASYVAGYVNKKLGGDDHSWKNEKEKELRLMSNRPGIGSDYSGVIAEKLLKLKDTYSMEITSFWNGDVPNVVRFSGSMLPLGRYLKGKIREYLGRSKEAPLQLVESESRRLSELYRQTIENEKDPQAQRFLKAAGKKSFIIGSNLQKLRDFDCNSKIFGGKK